MSALGRNDRAPSPLRSVYAVDWVFEHAQKTPEASALGTPDGWQTYAQLSARIQSMAGALQRAGIGGGDFVVIALPHISASVVAALAASAVGACAVEINREWGPEAISAIFQQLQPKALVLFGQDARLWGGIDLPPHRFVALVHRTRPPFKMVQAFRVSRPLWMTEDGEVEEGKLPSLAMQDFARPPPDAPALLVFTSGSTATPRGVIQTHANIHANTAAICDYLALTPEDRACCILPFYYCYGKSVLQTHLYCGGSVFLDHRFMYPRVVMEAIASERCTGFAGVPLTFELLRRQAAMAGLSLSALRYVTQAGGGMTLETQRWVRETFAPAKLFVMYGQTEATARLTYLPPERAEEKEGSVGIPVQGVTVSILDDDGRVLEPRHTGNVVAQGPSITPGYWHAPEETAAVFKKGRLWTGDLGFLDKDGFLFLTGRAKDMLKISGHRVSALEIEQGLTAHPEVHEAAVLRTEDALGGEAAAAFVVLRKGGQVTELELKKYCREHLPPYKVPASIQFLDALPRSGAGKVQKAQLTALLPKDTP